MANEGVMTQRMDTTMIKHADCCADKTRWCD